MTLLKNSFWSQILLILTVQAITKSGPKATHESLIPRSWDVLGQWDNRKGSSGVVKGVSWRNLVPKFPQNLYYWILYPEPQCSCCLSMIFNFLTYHCLVPVLFSKNIYAMCHMLFWLAFLCFEGSIEELRIIILYILNLSC